jgi:Meckel syndrome type 1 protein
LTTIATLMVTTAPGAIATPASPGGAALSLTSFLDLLTPDAAIEPAVATGARQAIAGTGTTLPGQTDEKEGDDSKLVSPATVDPDALAWLAGATGIVIPPSPAPAPLAKPETPKVALKAAAAKEPVAVAGRSTVKTPAATIADTPEAALPASDAPTATTEAPDTPADVAAPIAPAIVPDAPAVTLAPEAITTLAPLTVPTPTPVTAPPPTATPIARATGTPAPVAPSAPASRAVAAPQTPVAAAPTSPEVSAPAPAVAAPTIPVDVTASAPTATVTPLPAAPQPAAPAVLPATVQQATIVTTTAAPVIALAAAVPVAGATPRPLVVGQVTAAAPVAAASVTTDATLPTPVVETPVDATPRAVHTPLPAAAAAPLAASTPAIETAARTFADAIHRAVTGDDRAAPADPLTATPAPVAAQGAITTAAVIAPAPTQQATVDMTHARWPQAMVDHIEKLRDMADANDMRIRLIPDALGAIDVAMKRTAEGVSVQLTAEQPQTRQLLAEAQPRLTEMAQERGLKMQQTSTDTPPNQNNGSQNNGNSQTARQAVGQQMAQQQGQSPQQQPQQHAARVPAAPPSARRRDADEATDSTDQRIA